MRTARSGYTLSELVIAMTVFATMLGGLFTFMQSGMRGAKLTSTRALLARRTGHAVNHITEALLLSDADTLSPANPPLGSSFLDYQVPLAVTAAGVVWDNAARVEWQADPADPSDGVDNNGNGLIDEGRVVVLRDFGLVTQRDTVIATDVARFLQGETANNADDNGNGLQDESGLCFERAADGRVIVRLTLLTRNDRGVLRHTVESSVAPRN